MTVLNYSSYAHVIEKGMNKRNMTGEARVLFDFMCDHEDVVKNRNGERYNVPNKEAIQWFRGEHDVAEVLINAAGDPGIIQDTPDYFEEHVLEGLVNPQKIEIVMNEMLDLIQGDSSIDNAVRDGWIKMYEDGDQGAFLANIFLYAITMSNDLSKLDEEIITPSLDDDDARELAMFERLVDKHKKPQSKIPPLEIAPKEMKYVKQLLMAYASAENVPCIEQEDLYTYPKYKKYQANFERQRRDYYSAETVRESSRDILKIREKDGFDLVKDEILDGVIDVWELNADQNGYRRMLKVLNEAKGVQLSTTTRHKLLDWIDAAEKKGICHILVGEDRLWWVEDDEE